MKGQSPPFDWASGLSTSSYASGNELWVETSTIYYQASEFVDSADVDPGTGVQWVSNNGHMNGLLLKYDINNTLIWYRQFTGKTGCVNSIKTVCGDGNGRLYLAGVFSDSLDLDPGPDSIYAISSGFDDCFLICLDTSGQYLWGRAFGGSGYQSVSEITCNQFGQIYVTGTFSSIMYFSPNPSDTLIAGTNSFSYLCRFDSTGSFRWARSLQGGPNYTNALAADNNGNVVAGGGFSGSVYFDWSGSSNSFTANGDDIFIMKFDSSSAINWVRSLGGIDSDGAEAIAIDASGNIYTIGVYKDIVDFDPGVNTNYLTSQGNWDIFILKLDSNGLYQWSKSIGGTDYEWGYGIDVDQNGAVYATGHFAGTADFDPGANTFSLSSPGFEDIFVLKLATGGGFRWAFAIGGPDFDIPHDIEVISQNNFLLTGVYEYYVDFDPDPIDTFLLIAPAGGDAFTAHYGQSIVAVPEITESSFNSNGVLMLSSDNILYLNCNAGILQFSIYDETGRLLKNGETICDNNRCRIDFQYPAGFYIVTIYNQEKYFQSCSVFKSMNY